MNQVTAFASISGSSVNPDTGVISGVSVISEGPALGHGLTIDATTLAQVKACAEQFTDGLRVKMDHCTGIDAMVGVLRSFRITGNQLRADLHLIKSHDDFSKLIEMAQTIPGAFGLSIVFSGQPEQQGQQRLARCIEIYSCDIVDQPAANPTGLFSKPMENQEPTTPAATELEAEVMVNVTVVASAETPEEETAEQPEMDPTIEATPASELTSMVEDFTALSSKLAVAMVELAAKDTTITELGNFVSELSSRLVRAEAELAAKNEAHARLSELHAAAKRSLGVMPAAVLPEVSITATEKTAADYRAEFAAIKDPSARAAYFAANQNNLFGN